MRCLLLGLPFLFGAGFLFAQNVGINTPNPTEDLHIRTDSSKVALRLDNKKSAESGLNHFTTIGTPISLENYEVISSYEDWTDLDHTKLVNSDDNRLNSPQLVLWPELANQLRIQFSFDNTVPTNANIYDVVLHVEWRRIGTYTGELRLSQIRMLQGPSNNPNIIMEFGLQRITSSTDIEEALSYEQLYNPLTPDMINLNDVTIALVALHSVSQGLSRLEIDKIWLEVAYSVPAEGSENVSWTAGAKDGDFIIALSQDLMSNKYFTIDETGLTQVKGLKISKNAGAGKVLTSNDDGRAFWAEPQSEEQDPLWLDVNDTAFYASGPVQIHNQTGKAALIFDKGESRLNNGINFLETDNRLLNVIVDANNDQVNEQFNIYRDSTQFVDSLPQVRFNLDAQDSWINGEGNFGIGTTNPRERLEVNGSIIVGGETNANAVAGTIRWNPVTEDFQGYDGYSWKSLTGGASTGNSNTGIPSSTATCCEEHLTSSDGGSSAQVGRSVDIYGDYAAVGSLSTFSNKVYIFRKDSSTANWIEHQIIQPPPGVFIGDQIKINGDHLMILANSTNDLIFFKRTDTTWVQDTVFSYAGSLPTSRKIDLDGNRAIQVNGSDLYIYEYIGGFWQTASTIFLGAFPDVDAALYGDRIVYIRSGIGEYEIVVYGKYGTIWGIETIWTEPTYPSSLDIYGDYIVIGFQHLGFSPGYADVYHYDGTDWLFQQAINPSDGLQGDAFGHALEMLGDYLIVGAPFATANENASAGKAYIFHYDGTTWQESEILTDPIGEANDDYGYSVSIDAINRVVGAPTANPNGVSNQGKVIFGPAN